MIYYNLIYSTILGGYSYMCVYIYIQMFVMKLIMVYLKIKMVEFLITLYIKLVLWMKFLFEWLFTTTKNTNDFPHKIFNSGSFSGHNKIINQFFCNFKIIFSAKRSWALIRKLWVRIDISLSHYSYLSYN